MRKSAVLGAIAALGFAGPVLAAEGVSYNLIEGSYIATEIDDVDVDGEGFSVAGSFEFSEGLFGFASINDISYEGPVSSSALSLGVGAHWGLTSMLDLVAGVSFERLRVKVSGVSASEEGFGASLGLRGNVVANVELSAGLKYRDYGDGVDGTTLSAGGRYYFTPAFALGLQVSDDDDGTAWEFVMRYDFGSSY